MTVQVGLDIMVGMGRSAPSLDTKQSFCCYDRIDLVRSYDLEVYATSVGAREMNVTCTLLFRL
jgi:hypothetical protein